MDRSDPKRPARRVDEDAHPARHVRAVDERVPRSGVRRQRADVRAHVTGRDAKEPRGCDAVVSERAGRTKAVDLVADSRTRNASADAHDGAAHLGPDRRVDPHEPVRNDDVLEVDARHVRDDGHLVVT